MTKRAKTAALLIAAAMCFSLIVIPASADESAPVAENLELTTYRGVSIGGRLEADDPGELELTFEITTEPVKGKVELQEDGSFVYTPGEGKKGRDYFGYRAINSDGVASQEATVIIRIEKQKTSVTYSDMGGNGSGYAAVLLAEKGVYTGKCIGGKYVFSPDEDMTRAEFLSMCMSLGDVDMISAVRSTGFSDDTDIPAWAKPCVSTALLNGYISGSESDGRTVFEADRPITRAEAAVMLSRVLGITNLVSVAQYDSEIVPAWAAAQTAGLEARSIINVSDGMYETLSRADAADILASAIEFLSED